MCGQELPNSLQFNDHRMPYNEVRPKRTHPLISEPHINRHLSPNIQSNIAQSEGQGCLIDRFQEPITKFPMDGEERTEDLICQCLVD